VCSPSLSLAPKYTRQITFAHNFTASRPTMPCVSSVIGKDSPPVGVTGAPTPAELAVKAENADKEVRAERFRAALGQPPAPGHEAAARQPSTSAAEARAREAAAFNRFLSASKPGGKDEKAGGAKGEAASRKPGGEKAEGERKADGGDDELSALAGGGSAGGQADGTAIGRKGRGAGGEGSGGGSDDPGVGVGAASGPEANPKAGRPQSKAEESIADVAAAISAAALPPGVHSWARPEGPAQGPQRPRELPQPLPGVDPVHQLLIGKGPNGSEAKMIISVGPLAGTTINLREGPGGLEAQILTQTASARQTLTSAMQSVASRLKDRGHKLDVKFDNAAQIQQRPDQERRQR
jgi:hypothetical protein